MASQVVVHLGWVDSDLGSSLGWRAATVATYCPGRVVEHPKCRSTQPRCMTTWDALYSIFFDQNDWRDKVSHLFMLLGWVDLVSIVCPIPHVQR